MHLRVPKISKLSVEGIFPDPGHEGVQAAVGALAPDCMLDGTFPYHFSAS